MKATTNWGWVGVSLGLLWGVGCGGARPAEPAAPEPAPPQPSESAPPAASESAPAPVEPAEPAPAPSAQGKFEDLSPVDKLKLMKTVVAPEMAKLFQSLDPEKYKDFGCVNCHGPGVKEGKFDMPSDAIPKLPKDIGEVFKTKPDMAKFMSEQVVPKMASMLGEEPFNPETHQGFGCLQCHKKEP